MPVTFRDFGAGFAALARPERALRAFASDLRQATGSAECYLVASGRMALVTILHGLGRLSDSRCVIVPAYGCPTVVQAVLAAGLEPVFCDVDPRTLDLDRGMLEALLADRRTAHDTLAVIAVHLYGLAQDVRPVLELARARGIFVIEDAAQAFGARLAGRMVGTWGDAGFYSLGRGKCLPVGHGGVIVATNKCAEAVASVATSRDSLPPHWDVASLPRLLGYALATHPRVWWFVVRTSLNPADAGMDTTALPPIRWKGLSPVEAGAGRSMLARLGEVQEIQRRHGRRLMGLLTGVRGVSLPEAAADAEPVFLRLPVVLREREHTAALFRRLSALGIGVSRSYRKTLPDLFASAPGVDGRDFPGARHLAQCLLTLPTNPYLMDDEIARIEIAFRDL
jgi:dTDP-4-amino-4,6-dideoxygalactose transaminase